MGRHRARIAGLDTEWVEAGPAAGAPLVLLHGGGFDNAHLAWNGVLPTLSQAGFRVITPDLPGYGGTDSFGGEHGIADLAPWLSALLSHLDLGPVILGGNSLGGATALAVTLTGAHPVRGLVLINSYGLGARPPGGSLYWLYTRTPLKSGVPLSVGYLPLGDAIGTMVLHGRLRVTQDQIAAIRAEARRQSQDFTFQKFLRHEVTRTGFRTCLTPELGRVTTPTLLIHGRHDPAIPIRHARAAAARLPNATLVEMDAGHWPMREAPQAVAGAMLPWLAQLPARHNAA